MEEEKMEGHVPFIGRVKEINIIRKIINLSDDTYGICIGESRGIGNSRLLRKIDYSQYSCF
jgi:hypothetical protein